MPRIDTMDLLQDLVIFDTIETRIDTYSGYLCKLNTVNSVSQVARCKYSRYSHDKNTKEL